MVKKRKIPLRKCVASGEMKPKKDMVRIVRSKEGDVSIDPSGKQNGRGAYVSLNIDIVEKAKEQDAIGKSLGVSIDSSFYDELLDYIDYRIARLQLENEQ